MDPKDLIADLRERDVWFGVEEDQIYLNAPVGVLTEDIREALRAERSELLALHENFEGVRCERGLANRWWEHLAYEAFGLHDDGDDGSEEYARRVRDTHEELGRVRVWAKEADARHDELEQLFQAKREDQARRWREQLRSRPPVEEVDTFGALREVIRI
jgi:hypothetical protein